VTDIVVGISVSVLLFPPPVRRHRAARGAERDYVFPFFPFSLYPCRKQRNGSESEYTEKLQQYSKSLCGDPPVARHTHPNRTPPRDSRVPFLGTTKGSTSPPPPTEAVHKYTSVNNCCPIHHDHYEVMQTFSNPVFESTNARSASASYSLSRSCY